MMTSLVLLVPIVVSVTAAPLQQILDDRPISQSKDTLPVSPEVGVGSVKVDSKKPSRKQSTKVNSDSKEIKTSQVLFPIGNQDDRLSSLPRTFPVLPESGLAVSKKSSKKQATNGTSRFQNGTNKLQTGTNKLQTGTNKLQSGTKETKTTRLNQSTSPTERPIPKSKSTTPENQSPESEVKGMVVKKSRKHKAFFLNYPFVPQIHHHYPNVDHYPHYDSNFEDCAFGVEERTPGGKKKYQDSNIYYIRLPPTPYMFVPGLGYVSQPPRYSPPPFSPPITHVRPMRPSRPPTIYQPHVNPFVKVPIDFISNGKPTSVYQLQNGKPAPRPENRITNLDKGPYVFNGRPNSIYIIRPDGSQTVPQPIRYPDYQDNGYY